MLRVAYAALITAGLSGVIAMAQDKKKTAISPDSLYALKTHTLEGKEVDLREYAGKVSLVVNLASQ